MNVESFTTFSTVLIVFGIFSIAFLIQLWYYGYFFSKLFFYKKKEHDFPPPPVSIIICARNEEKNLINFLPLVFEQDYPNFEVVVVNHCSVDNTADILDEFSGKHVNLKIVTISETQNYSHGKKVALMMGIKGAAHEHLLLTDADCRPNNKNWISNMMSSFSPDTDVVLGYGGYEKGKGLLNKIIRFDTFIIGLQYLSFALAKKTYMGIGRNLAYTKSIFYKAKGFASHYHIESGDDDLFINEIASKFKSNIAIEVEGTTVSIPKKSFRELFRQKRRHHTTFQKYSTASKLRLCFLTCSQYLFFTTVIILLVLQFEPITVLSMLIFRMSIQFTIFNRSMKLLQEKDLLLFSPILEIALLIIYPLIAISKVFIKKSKWTN